MSRTLKIVLACSLAINLLLVGGIIGRIAAGPPGGQGPMPQHLGWLVRDLPEEQRAAVRPQLQAYQQAIRPLRRDMRAAQRRFNNLLRSDTVDEAELNAALAELRKHSERFQRATHEAMVGLVKHLDADQRRKLFARLQRGEGRGPRPGRDGAPGHPPPGERPPPDGPP